MPSSAFKMSFAGVSAMLLDDHLRCEDTSGCMIDGNVQELRAVGTPRLKNNSSPSYVLYLNPRGLEEIMLCHCYIR